MKKIVLSGIVFVLASCVQSSDRKEREAISVRADAPPQTLDVVYCDANQECPADTECADWDRNETPEGCRCDVKNAPAGTPCAVGMCNGGGVCLCQNTLTGTTCPQRECMNDVCCQGRCLYQIPPDGRPCGDGGTCVSTPSGGLVCH